jgi:hypothetical protein
VKLIEATGFNQHRENNGTYGYQGLLKVIPLTDFRKVF